MRLYTAEHLEAFGTMLAALLVIAFIASPTGRNVLAWIYLQSTQAIEHSVHHPFPLNRLDPTCQECM